MFGSFAFLKGILKNVQNTFHLMLMVINTQKAYYDFKKWHVKAVGFTEKTLKFCYWLFVSTFSISVKSYIYIKNQNISSSEI